MSNDLWITLQAELHARPHPVLSGDHAIAHAVYLGAPQEAFVARLKELVRDHGWTHGEYLGQVGQYSRGDVRLRVEYHHEFTSVAVYVPGAGAAPFSVFAWDALPSPWREDLPGIVVVRLRLHLAAADARPLTRDDLEPVFGDHQFVAARISDGRAAMWSDYRLDPTGWARFIVQDFGLSPRRCGRLVQRLHDLETYRQMALVSLPLARRLLPKVDALEARLTSEVSALSGPRHSHDDRVRLDRLTELAIAAEDIRAESAMRLRATAAYAEIFSERLGELRAEKIAGFQTPGEFLARRVNPGLRTCAALQERLAELSQRITRAADLLRTRVEMALEAQNHALLTSMDRRAELQVRLQATVEGLSVVVLTYYSVALLKVVLHGCKEAGWHVHPDLTTGIAVPVVALVVWLGMCRLRKRLGT